jgi:Family of unknown function (DUF5329)
VPRFLSSLLVSIAVAAGAHAQARRDAEAQKIESLIRAVERLSNAKFIRNGVAYDSKAAAEHLRRKLRNAGSHCKTAEEFIALCAAKSSETGKPYQIRFADGKVLSSEAFLRQRLKELERQAK